MSDIIGVGRRVSSLKVSPQFDTFSKVILKVSNDTAYIAGDDSGRTIEVSNPFGTQAMANKLLARLSGFQYQPYTASGALLDPSAEIGDFANMADAFGGIFSRDIKFGRLMKSDISSPTDEEIDHEYHYESSERREYTRRLDEVKASILVEAGRIDLLTSKVTAAESSIAKLSVDTGEISASVEQKLDAEGGSTSKVSWSLLSTEFSVFANNKKVFSVTKDGATVEGTIRATSGAIGGFVIGKNAIYKNIEKFGASQKTGVYLGTDGIQLGNNFSVDNGGNVTARNMTLKGTLYFQKSDGTSAGSISAADLKQGAEQAYNNYGSWNSAYESTSPGGYCYGGAGGGWIFNKAQASSTPVNSFFGRTVGIFDSLAVYQTAKFNCYGDFYKGNTLLTLKTKTIDGETINYLGW